MSDVDFIKNTLDILYEKETYTFKIPSYLDQLAIESRKLDIYKTISDSLDFPERTDNVALLITIVAYFELLLVRSSATWPWSSNNKIDFTSWPLNIVHIAISVGLQFQHQLNEFVRSGLATNTLISKKLWRASRILNCSPFSKELLDHNEARLDFILEMYSLDHPNELKFTRPGKDEEGLREAKARAGWADVLMGDAYDEYIKNKIPSKGVLDKLRTEVESPGGVVELRPNTHAGTV